MPKAPPVPLTACCMMKLESFKLSFEPTEVVVQLRERLEKRLAKKGFAVQWVPQPENPALLVHLVKINEGNQMMRYMIPFASPAVAGIAGRIAGGAAPREFSFTQKAHFGLFGGSPKSMMKMNADRLAAKIAKEVVKAARG